MGIVSELKAIIDLLHKRDESNKLKIDTEIARHELADRQRLIQAVQLDDVRRYDPNTAHLMTTVDSEYHPVRPAQTVPSAPMRSRLPIVVAILALLAVILLVVWLL